MHALTIYSPWAKGGRWLPGAVPYWQGVLDTDALLERMTTHTETEDKGKTRAWSPVRLKPGTRRANANVLEVSCLVMDFDTIAVDRGALLRAFGRVACCYHSSHSHTESKPKGRMVYPLTSPVPGAMWPRFWRWAASKVPGMDPQCKDVSRVYYLPTRPPGVEPVAWVQRGPLLCVPDDLPELPKPPPYRPVPDTSDRSLIESLRRPDVRERLAASQGWRVCGSVVRYIPCPRCGRKSVRYHIDSEAKALCNHRSSCGGTFWLDQLIGK